MFGIGHKRAGRRFGRRPALLLALGLVSCLGATGAVAAALVGGSARHPHRPLVIRVTPASHTITPGASATYTVRVARFGPRIGLSGRTEIAVHDGGLPTGANASISSRPLLGASRAFPARTTLTITTAADTPPGSYRVRLGARRPHRRGGAAVELTVSRPSGPPATPPGITPPVTTPDAFTIAGTLPVPLTPGTGEPLDLILTNRESADLRIASLDVEVSRVSGPGIDSSHGCDGEDFAVEQFSGALGFTLPASSSADLSELGIDRRDWPTISMLDRPFNQDGCKGALLALSFTGSATEAG